MNERLKLESLAVAALEYKFVEMGDMGRSALAERDLYLLGNDYKRKIISEMGTDQLINIILTRPVISLRKSDINTSLTTIG